MEAVELSQDVLLATKLYMPPPRPGWVRRPELTARLSTGLRGPLTLIVAPAGWGKTTLLGDWRAMQREDAWPTAWLALDAGDSDLARFLRYVVAALRTVQADIGDALLASLRSPQPPPAEHLLTLLLNDLTTLSGDVVLILDDYHVVEAPSVHRALDFLIEHLPPQVHLVIATRTDPPLQLARLRARSQLTELRADDLRFNAVDTATFLGAMGLQLSAEDMATLEARTEGWIAGLQLAGLSLRGRDPAHLSDAITALTGTQRYILDYLADEVFDHQSEDVRRFLLRTSVLDRLSGPLCDTVAVEPDAPPSGRGQAMLERLDAANLFVVPLDDTRTWYRYHHLFSGFLQERAGREDAELVPELHRRASRWFERQGLIADAAEHALKGASYEQAARLIEQAIQPLLWQRGELATLLRWLERLPRDVTRRRPRLTLDLAWMLLWSTQVGEIESRLQDAEQTLMSSRGQGDLPRVVGSAKALRGLDEKNRIPQEAEQTPERALRGEIAAIRAEVARQRGDLIPAIELARQALADLPKDDRLVRGATLGLLAGAYLWSGDAAAAERAYADAVELAQSPETITLGLIAGGRLVQVRAMQGRLHEAASMYRQSFELATDHGMAGMPPIGVAQVGMAEVLREWNDLDGAEELVRKGITRCREWNGLAEMGLDGYLTLARLLRARGDADGSLSVLEQAEMSGREGHVPRYSERVAIERVRLWLDQGTGGLEAAIEWARSGEHAWTADRELDYVGLHERIMLARLRISQGRRREAADVLDSALAFAEAGELTGRVIEILTLQARASLEEGNAAQAMVAFAQALRLAEPEGYIRLFADEGAPMVGLLWQARARGVAPSYVGALLAACGAMAVGGSKEALIEPLSAREREVLRLLAAGLSTVEIATELFLTAGTVRNHLKSIYGKLDVHSRVQAVERARRLNLL